MILKLNVWEVGNAKAKGFRIYIGEETRKKLEMQAGYKTWFYKNEHGVFMKVGFPGTDQRPPKEPIEINWNSRVSALEIVKAELGRFLLEFCKVPGADDPMGTYVFELQETSKADVLRIIYIMKSEGKGWITEKNVEEKKENIKTQAPTKHSYVRKVNKETLYRETSGGYLKPVLDKVPTPKKPEPRDITQEVTEKWEEAGEVVKEKMKTERELKQEVLRRITEWTAADLNTLAGRLRNLEITKDEENALREDVKGVLKRTLERLG